MLETAESSWSLIDAAHLIRRAGFGAPPAEIARIHELGREAAVEALFSQADPVNAFPDPDWMGSESLRVTIRERLTKRRDLRNQLEKLDRSSPEAEAVANQIRNLQREAQRELSRQGIDIQRHWWDRILTTRAPLREKMTLFWHDHFATSLQKVREPALMLAQNHLFRQHALGSFHDLTRAIVTNPAMMIYLDVQNSRRGKPNENFARELFELFTLGEGNYTEADIREAARAFTGYRIDRAAGTARLNRRNWDGGEKLIFAKSGRFRGDDVVDLIFERPDPARLIGRKLWEYFVAESPSSETIEALAGIIRRHDHQIEPVLRAIFLSRAFYQPEVIGNQIKSPVQFLAQMLHELEIKEPPRGFLLSAQSQLGQQLYHPPNVAGWDHGKSWINTNTLLARYNLAGFIATGTETSAQALAAAGMRRGGQGMQVLARRSARQWSGPDYEALVPRSMRDHPAAIVDTLIDRLGLQAAPARARESFLEFANEKHGVIFTNKEVAELTHLMLSTPYYQLC